VRRVRHDTIAWSANVAVAPAASRGVRRSRRDTRPAPREAAVRRPRHEDAALVVLPHEMQVVVVRRPTAIEDNGWIPAAVDVVACGVCVRRKRPDSVVEMLA